MDILMCLLACINLKRSRVLSTIIIDRKHHIWYDTVTYIIHHMNIKTLVATIVVGVAIVLPSSASAEIPQAVTDAYEALYGGEPYKTNFTSLTTVDIFGVLMQTKMKGTGSQDADGDISGTTDVTITVSNQEKKGSKKEVAIAMEFRYMLEEEIMYFKFKKLPKELSSSLSNIRTNVWYSQAGDENLAKLMGESPFSNENFIAANEKYPAYIFKEKGSTKKEAIYAFSVNGSMVHNFFKEQARLNGDESALPDAAFLGTLLGSTKGTLRIDAKTDLPKSMVIHLGEDTVSSDLSASYMFSRIRNVTAPTKAIESDVLDVILGDT